MFKKMTILLTASAILTMATGISMAAVSKCTITSIKDNIVTLDCGKKAGKMKVGDAVKLKTARKKAIEGC